MLTRILTGLLHENLFSSFFSRHVDVSQNVIAKTALRGLKVLDLIISFLPKNLARYMIPIQSNRIVFMTNTFNYTCNPKYICEQMLEENVDCDIVWVTNNITEKKQYFPPDVKLVSIKSLKCFYYVYSAKIWINNGVAFSDYYDKKKGQFLIQTMHGSLGIKRLDNAVLSRNSRGFFGKRVVKRESENTDLVITNSLFEEEVFKSVFWKNTPMKRLGHARTDILLTTDELKKKYIRQRLCERFHIPADKKFVLYGPTHRTGLTVEDLAIDFPALVDALHKRFGEEYIVLLRLHNRNAGKIMLCADNQLTFDVTDYQDMQELMLVSDIAITDYSSWIYDYVVTYKRGFIYATDLERYNNKTGLYYTLEETPFPVCHNNEELIANVRSFDDNLYQQRVKEFLDEKQAVDDGHSAERIVAEIKQVLAL